VRELVDVAAKIAAAGVCGTDSVRLPEVADAVERDCPQPGAECAGAAVVLEIGEPLEQHAEDLLRQVVGIGLWNIVSPQPTANQRRVKLDEAVPRSRVGAAVQPVEQAGRGGKHEVSSCGNETGLACTRATINPNPK